MTQHVGSYEVVRVLARGGMAVVYLARQPTLDRSVALKRLLLESRDPTLAQRFVREAQLAAGLGHPNVVTLFDFFEDDGVPYIAMEYVGGGSLRRLVGRLRIGQVFGVLEGILAGLEHAETRGVVHRDLKPENVLVTPGGSVKIADFGIARAYNALTPSLTSTDSAIGTPAYMAPEQVTDERLGPYTDLYAVGIIAYELLAGRPPFDPDGGPMAVLYCQVHKSPPPLAERAPEAPAALCRWVERLLAKDPSARYASAAEAGEALEEMAVSELGPYWRRSAAISAESEPVPTLVVDDGDGAPARPTAATRVLLRRRRRLATGAAVALTLAGGAVAAVALVHSGAPPPRAGAARPGGRPAAARPYDFDGDGRAEMVLGMPGSGRRKAGAVVVHIRDQSRVITPKAAGFRPPYDADENFGRSVASGDFNGDGRADLAASAPGRDRVAILRGTEKGLRRDRVVKPGQFRFEAGAARYGNRILAADMDRDGYDDLVVAAPDADTGEAPASGVIEIVFGSRHGLGSRRQEVLRPDESLADFGTSLQAGDFDGDHHVDLIEGAPDTATVDGHANFCRGTRKGLPVCQPLGGPGSFGTSTFAVGNVNGDKYDDILQGDDIADAAGAAGGEVRLWLGGRHGPADQPIKIDQEKWLIPGRDEAGDGFGHAVSTGKLDDDRYDDIVIGAPGEDDGDGAVTIVRGGKDGTAQAGHVRFYKHDGGIRGAAGTGEHLGSAIAVLDIVGNKRPDVLTTARYAKRLEDAVYVLQAMNGAFAPGEIRVRRPLRPGVKLRNPNIGLVRIGRPAGT